MKIKPGDILSYLDMCQLEGVSLQRGMNFRLKSDYSVILMSIRPGAPYADQVLDDGRLLIYEGHDISKTKDIKDPKEYDQPLATESGSSLKMECFMQLPKDIKMVKIYRNE